MAKYRKKPVIIDAEQWIVPHEVYIPKPAIGKPDLLGVIWQYGPDGKLSNGIIETLEDNHIVSFGDWIITGIKGERYPVKNEIFKETYEFVSD